MTIQRAWQRASAEQAHAIELPLVWYSDGQATFGHPRLRLRVVTTAEPGGTFGHRAFLKLDVRSDDREVFISKVVDFLRGDTEEGRKLAEAESAFAEAEKENEIWSVVNITGYEEIWRMISALSRELKNATNPTKKTDIRSIYDDYSKRLFDLRVRAGKELPHPISEWQDLNEEENRESLEKLQWEIDQASNIFKKIVRTFVNNNRLMRENLSAFLESEGIPLLPGKLFRRFVIGFGRESDMSRTSALYSLEAEEEEIVKVETDCYGNPVDTQEEEPIFVDIETVIKAVGNGKLISEHGSFAYFPGRQTTDVSTSFMQHVAERVGNGLVGTVVDGICEWVVLPKSLLMQVLQSMAHYRKMGIIPAVMDATKQ